jgi:hypothetical protein
MLLLLQDLDEDGGGKDEQFPPASETADETKNWPGTCPFLHLKFKDFAILDKQAFIRL